MPNVELYPFKKPSMWRKMSLANWKHPTDPSVYGRLEVDMTQALAYADSESERSGAKVTPTHIVVRATALALRRHSAANAIVRFNRIYERKQVDIFCQVAIAGDKPDLSGAVIRNADRKKAGDIAAELRDKALAVREDRDEELGKSRKSLDLLPAFLYRPVLWFLAILQYTFNLDLRFLGLPRNAFGSAMVTSIGSLGIDEGFAPLVPMSRTPIVLSVGKVSDRAVVVDGQIVIRSVCVLSACFDHRIMDGLTGGKLGAAVSRYMADPAAYESALEQEGT